MIVIKISVNEKEVGADPIKMRWNS